MRFSTDREYENWINTQDWYQTIELKNGLQTPGKFPTHKRLKYLDHVDFTDKRVLDIGCNSGQYSMYAKRKGAKEVIGVDINTKRLEQARILKENEGLDIYFYEKDLFNLKDFGEFDIVLCIAVLTEVQNFFGAIDVLKHVTGGYCFLEIDLAKPLLYISKSKRWFKRKPQLGRGKSILEYRSTKHGNMISPTFEVLTYVFGHGFKLEYRGKGVRYDMLDLLRVEKNM